MQELLHLTTFLLFPIKAARGHAHRVEMGKSLVLSDSPELFFKLIIQQCWQSCYFPSNDYFLLFPGCSPFTMKNSLANVWYRVTIFYSDEEPLSKYSLVTFRLSPPTRILNENPVSFYFPQLRTKLATVTSSASQSGSSPEAVLKALREKQARRTGTY